jgi:predicted nucleotidyltransferase
MHKAAKTRKVRSCQAVNKRDGDPMPSFPQHSPPVPETSSDPAPIPLEQRKLFQQVLTLLEENRIPFAIAGAFALQAHTGICRDTKDLDLFLTAGNAAIAIDLLRRQGFDCEVCDPVWLHKAHRNGFFVDLITGMSNAAIAVQNSWIERAKSVVVHGVHTRVLAAEELLVSKLFVTRRERFDGADIAHVIYGTHGRLDWQRILALVGEHWEILFWSLVFFHYAYPAQSEYVPKEVWQELMQRFQNAVLHPNPREKFRGSLIDDKMFAIDVREWGFDNLYLDLRNRRLQEIRVPPR